MLLAHGTVIALVDGENFELYRNAGTEGEVELTTIEAPKLDSQNHSDTGHHSRSGNHADSQVNEDAHANAATHWLNSQVLGHKIDKLVVIAPPRTLGEMRRHYHKQTEGALVGELPKDLIGKQPGDIQNAIREQL
ncbi:MAG: host attachment protein [Novosphingobium sp.]